MNPEDKDLSPQDKEVMWAEWEAWMAHPDNVHPADVDAHQWED